MAEYVQNNTDGRRERVRTPERAPRPHAEETEIEVAPVRRPADPAGSTGTASWARLADAWKRPSAGAPVPPRAAESVAAPSDADLVAERGAAGLSMADIVASAAMTRRPRPAGGRNGSRWGLVRNRVKTWSHWLPKLFSARPRRAAHAVRAESRSNPLMNDPAELPDLETGSRLTAIPEGEHIEFEHHVADPDSALRRATFRGARLESWPTSGELVRQAPPKEAAERRRRRWGRVRQNLRVLAAFRQGLHPTQAAAPTDSARGDVDARWEQALRTAFRTEPGGATAESAESTKLARSITLNFSSLRAERALPLESPPDRRVVEQPDTRPQDRRRAHPTLSRQATGSLAGLVQTRRQHGDLAGVDVATRHVWGRSGIEAAPTASDRAEQRRDAHGVNRAELEGIASNVLFDHLTASVARRHYRTGGAGQEDDVVDAFADGADELIDSSPIGEIIGGPLGALSKLDIVRHGHVAKLHAAVGRLSTDVHASTLADTMSKGHRAQQLPAMINRGIHLALVSAGILLALPTVGISLPAAAAVGLGIGLTVAATIGWYVQRRTHAAKTQIALSKRLQALDELGDDDGRPGAPQRLDMPLRTFLSASSRRAVAKHYGWIDERDPSGWNAPTAKRRVDGGRESRSFQAELQRRSATLDAMERLLEEHPGGVADSVSESLPMLEFIKHRACYESTWFDYVAAMRGDDAVEQQRTEALFKSASRRFVAVRRSPWIETLSEPEKVALDHRYLVSRFGIRRARSIDTMAMIEAEYGDNRSGIVQAGVARMREVIGAAAGRVKAMFRGRPSDPTPAIPEFDDEDVGLLRSRTSLVAGHLARTGPVGA